ncbi:MAG: hypothetical protein PVI59_16705 [Anaerolineae bacterium]|jgi:hypothetical protein
MHEQKNLLIVLGEWLEQRRSARHAVGPVGEDRWRGLLRWLMPNGGTLLLVLILALTANVWAEPLLGTTNAPGPSATTVNYQGRLADNAGVPLDGTYGMAFALYDAPTGGSLVWGPESHAAVPVSDGLFSVGLGSQTSGGIPTSVWNGDVYLEVIVSGETLEPRELIRAVPIAGMALTVPEGAVSNQQLALTRYELTTSVPDRFVLTDTEQVIGEITFEVPYAATYLAFVTYEADGNGGRSLLRLWDENDNEMGAINHSSQKTHTASEVMIFELPAGEHTLTMTAMAVEGVVGQEVRASTHAVIIPIAQVP